MLWSQQAYEPRYLRVALVGAEMQERRDEKWREGSRRAGDVQKHVRRKTHGSEMSRPPAELSLSSLVFRGDAWAHAGFISAWLRHHQTTTALN